METSGYNVCIIGPKSVFRGAADVAVDCYLAIETTWENAYEQNVRAPVGFFKTRKQAIEFARSVFGSMGYRVRY